MLVQRENSATRKVVCIKCIYCNRQIRLTSKFCSFCGKSVTGVPEQLDKKPVHPGESVIPQSVSHKNADKKPVSQKTLVRHQTTIPPRIPEKPETNHKEQHIIKDGGKVKSTHVAQVQTVTPPVENKKIEILPGDMMNCPYCQEKISIFERICNKCYRSLKKCPVCNIINRGIARFCRSCQSLFPSDKNEWPTFRGNNCRTGVCEQSLDFPFYFQWMYPKLDDSLGPLWASPVVAKDKVYVASKEKNLYAFNQFTGELIWRQPTKGAILCTPAVDEKKIYVGCDDGKVFAIDAEKGGISWFYETEVEIGASILVNQEKVYVPLKEGRIIVLNSAKGGSLAWCFPHRKSSPIKEIVSSPALYNNILVFASTGKVVYALQAGDGKVLWKYQTKSPVVASGAIHNGIVYLIDRGGHMAALDIKSGQDRWAGIVEIPGPFTASPSVKEDIVVVASQRGIVYGLDARTGGIKWENSFNSSSTQFEAINSSPVMTKDKVIVGTDGGSLYILEQSDGRNIWQFRASSWIWSSPAVSHGYVYITSNDGHVYSFSSKKPEASPGIIKML
ncbi:MAG: PQQ-binding-like beta-propeller repeat protein [Candidatus Eremiobacterota bacterium]